jgi:hypothetical protein
MPGFFFRQEVTSTYGCRLSAWRTNRFMQQSPPLFAALQTVINILECHIVKNKRFFNGWSALEAFFADLSGICLMISYKVHFQLTVKGGNGKA